MYILFSKIKGKVKKMKKIIKISILFILSCILISVNCISSTAYYELKYRNDYSGSYQNVKIDNIYYDLSIIGHKDGEYSVYATYPVVRGEVLKIPDKISFKGRKYKVTDVSFDPQESYNANSELPAKIILPYKTIYLPKYETALHISPNTKLPNLRKIYIPENLKDLNSLADMPKLKVIIDKKNPYIKMKNGAVYSKNGKRLLTLVNSKKTYKIPEGTTYIDFGFGRVNKTVEKIVLPSSLEKLPFDSLSSCVKLKSVKFNKELKNIGGRVFSGCKLIKSMNLPDNLEKIGFSAFENCRSLEKITIPKKIKKIKLATFQNCTELSKVKIKNNETSPKIEEGAFENTAEGIEFVVKNQAIADQLKEQLSNNKKGVKKAKILIGDKVVYDNINCRSKKSQNAYNVITIQNGIKYKLYSDGDIFKNNLIKDIYLKSKKIKIPNTVEYRNKIYDINAVEFYSYVNNPIIPQSAKTCEKLIADNFDSFVNVYKWNKLKEIKATNIKDTFEYIVSCDKLKKINVSGTDECECFICGISQNKSLIKITLKNAGVIANEAITDCKNLKTIILSGKVKYIQRDAISKCDNLKKIKIQTENKVKIYKKAFKDVPVSCKVYVKNKSMKKAVENSGFKGQIIISN